MTWDLPVSVSINGASHPIRNNCDYRVVLDAICALNDNDLTDDEKIMCALFIFYEDVSQIDDFEVAVKEMIKIIGAGEEDKHGSENDLRLMDWEHDFSRLAPPISRVLGYDIRTPDKYTHWYTFIGGYMEIGECVFSTIVSIRLKRSKGKKLEKWELDFLREHRDMVDLPQKLTAEEEELLNSQW